MRSYAQALLTTLPSQLLVPYLHPRFYALHTMPDDVSSSLSPSPWVSPLARLLASSTDDSLLFPPAGRYHRRARCHPARAHEPHIGAARATRSLHHRGRAKHLPLDRTRGRPATRPGRLRHPDVCGAAWWEGKRPKHHSSLKTRRRKNGSADSDASSSSLTSDHPPAPRQLVLSAGQRHHCQNA
jgi:hypothetical protein